MIIIALITKSKNGTKSCDYIYDLNKQNSKNSFVKID